MTTIIISACIALAAWFLVWIIGRNMHGCVCNCRQGREPCSCQADRRKHQTDNHPLRRASDWPTIEP